MKRTLLYLIIIVAGLFAVDRIGGIILDKGYLKSDNNENRAFSKASEDIIIIGSSRASHHYDPSAISDVTGLSCYNYGKDGQRIFYHYGILNLILGHHQPKMVIYDVNSTDVEILSRESNFSGLSAFYPLYGVNDSIKSLIKLQGDWADVKVNLSHLYRHNSIFIDYFVGGSDAGNGFSAVDGYWDEEIKLLDEDKNPSHCPLKHEYMQRLIDLCKTNNVFLVLAVSPKYALSDRNGITTKYLPLQKLADEKNVPFYYYEQDTLFTNHRELFKDELHLNRAGAALYSTIVAERIARDYIRR